ITDGLLGELPRVRCEDPYWKIQAGRFHDIIFLKKCAQQWRRVTQDRVAVRNRRKAGMLAGANGRSSSRASAGPEGRQSGSELRRASTSDDVAVPVLVGEDGTRMKMDGIRESRIAHELVNIPDEDYMTESDFSHGSDHYMRISWVG
ncbi:unnamed protein product, partial [Amoebophrya sp. A25]